MRWDLICFDLDNTLYSHEAAFEKAICFCFQSLFCKKKIDQSIDLNSLFKVFKKNCDLFWNEYETGILTPIQYRRKRFLHTVKDFFLPFTEEDADYFHDHYYDVVDDFSEPFPSLYQLMENLLKAQVKVGIITNGNVDTQYNKICKLKLDLWITEKSIFISEQLKVEKPDRKIFDIAKNILHREGNCLFIGDSWEHDVVGAIEAGWDAIYLNTRNELPKTSHEPIKSFNTLAEVEQFIYKENKLKG